MPIFEYECARCGLVSSHVVMGSSRRRERLGCPQCKSARLRRVMSSFAMVESESSRLADFDASKPRDDSYYRDSPKIGVWAEKAATEVGVALGSKVKAHR